MTKPAHKGTGHADLPLASDAPDAPVALVRLDQIVNLPRPDELRMDKPELQVLADDIAANGLDQEVQVRFIAEGVYELVDGRHRAVAHVVGSYETVPAKIRRDLDDKAAAVRTIKANQLRKDLSPLEQARDWQAALDTGLTQVQLSKEINVSQPVISKRLKLLDVPEAIARLAGNGLTVDEAPQFAPLMGRDEAAKRVAKELEKRLAEGRNPSLQWILNEALCQQKAIACMPLLDRYGSFVNNHPGVGYALDSRIVSNAKYREEIMALDVVKFPMRANADLVLCFDIQGAKDAIERTKQRLLEADAKKAANKPAASSRSSTSWKSPEQKRKEAIANKERRLQLEAMVAHVAKQESFGEELVKQAYRQLLSSVGQVASRKVEQEALAVILGEYAPAAPRSAYQSGSPLTYGRPELVDKLWDSNRQVLDRYVAAVVHLNAGGYDHHVTNDNVLKFTTGKSSKQLHAAAAAAVDAKAGKSGTPKSKPKKAAKATPAKKGAPAAKSNATKPKSAKKPAAKPKAKPASKPAMPKNGAKKPASAHTKGKAKVPDIPKDSPAAKAIHELHTNGKVPTPTAQDSPACPVCRKWIKPVNGKIPRHKDNAAGDWCITSGQDLAKTIATLTTPADAGAAAGKECPKCTIIVERRGTGKDARLVCGCTPLEIDGKAPQAAPAPSKPKKTSKAAPATKAAQKATNPDPSKKGNPAPATLRALAKLKAAADGEVAEHPAKTEVVA